MSSVEVYTDGSSKGNPGPGGYGVYMKYSDGEEKRFSEGYYITTNNRMELMSFTYTLEYLKLTRFKGNVFIFTDSKYINDAINKGWLKKWERENFKGRINSDLWIRVSQVIPYFTGKLKVQWVKGHSDIEGNIIADELAVKSAMNPTKVDEYYEGN